LSGSRLFFFGRILKLHPPANVPHWDVSAFAVPDFVQNEHSLPSQGVVVTVVKLFAKDQTANVGNLFNGP
jgi:hypothetical protein